MGSSYNCGVENKLPIYPSESSLSNEWKVFWKCLKLEVIGVNEDGRPKKRVKECFKETSSSTFIEYLRPNIQKFVKHDFVARWQDA
jgi:hypothetical protein